MRRYLLFLLALPLCAAPTVTVSASAQTLLGSNQSISITLDLVDPNNTGLLRVNGTNIIPIMTASTVTPGATATVGPVYGNDVIRDGFGNLNGTYYRARVFAVINGIISSTAAFQQFFAFTGAGTVDLATATPLAPSFMTGTNGSVSIPGTTTTAQLNGCQYVNVLQTFAQALATASNPGCIAISPGTYTVSANAAIPTGITLVSTSGGLLSIANAVTLTINGPISASTSQIFSYTGSGTVALGVNAGPVYANWFPGADIHAQLNNAYAAMPTLSGSNAGTIIVSPNNGTCYTATTQLLFNTNGKAANIDFQGACITWTPTGTDAQVYDWGQGNVAVMAKIQNLHLTGPCTTTACSGVTSRGMVWGPTNGLVNATFQNILIGTTGSGTGFLNGIAITSGNSFLDYCVSCSINRNNIGVNVTAGGGGDIFFGGGMSQNSIGLQTNNSSSGKAFIGTEFDDNTTTDYNRLAGSTTNDEFTNCRFENSVASGGFATATVFTDNISTGTVIFSGGTILNDATTGNTAAYFNVAATNSTNSTTLITRDIKIQSAGQTATVAYALGNGTYKLSSVINGTAPTNIFNSNLTGAVYSETSGGTNAFRTIVTSGGYGTQLATLGLGSSPTNGFTFTPDSTAALRAVRVSEPFQASILMGEVDNTAFTTGHLVKVKNTVPIMQDAGFGPIQNQRVAGCATAASQFATCDVTVTWSTAFADANYTAVCSGDVVTSGVPIVEGINISAAKVGASITVRTTSLTAVAAQFTTIDCTATHD